MARCANFDLKAGLLTLIATFVLGACSESQTRKLVAFATPLRASLNAFEEERSEAQETIKDTEKAVDDLTRSETPEQSVDAAEVWERAAAELSSRITALKQKFEVLGADGRGYFKALDEETARIKNVSLKAATEEKNRTLKVAWNAAFAAAAESVGRLSQLDSDAADISIVMRTAAMRQSLRSNLSELRKISDETRVAIADLSRLSAAGQEILKFAPKE